MGVGDNVGAHEALASGALHSPVPALGNCPPYTIAARAGPDDVMIRVQQADLPRMYINFEPAALVARTGSISSFTGDALKQKAAEVHGSVLRALRPIPPPPPTHPHR